MTSPGFIRSGVLISLALSALMSAVIFCGEPPEEIRIINFPETQKVEGSVNIEGTARVTGAVDINGTVSHASYRAYRDIQLRPVPRGNIRGLAEGGTLDTMGFTRAVISMQGSLETRDLKPGSIGVILVPDEKPIEEAMFETGIMLFSIESGTDVDINGAGYFGSEQTAGDIGFPRYRIYMYNSTNKTADINLFIYLTH